MRNKFHVSSHKFNVSKPFFLFSGLTYRSKGDNIDLEYHPETVKSMFCKYWICNLGKSRKFVRKRVSLVIQVHISIHFLDFQTGG